MGNPVIPALQVFSMAGQPQRHSLGNIMLNGGYRPGSAKVSRASIQSSVLDPQLNALGSALLARHFQTPLVNRNISDVVARDTDLKKVFGSYARTALSSKSANGKNTVPYAEVGAKQDDTRPNPVQLQDTDATDEEERAVNAKATSFRPITSINMPIVTPSGEHSVQSTRMGQDSIADMYPASRVQRQGTDVAVIAEGADVVSNKMTSFQPASSVDLPVVSPSGEHNRQSSPIVSDRRSSVGHVTSVQLPVSGSSAEHKQEGFSPKVASSKTIKN